jgi:hypothetical protein
VQVINQVIPSCAGVFTEMLKMSDNAALALIQPYYIHVGVPLCLSFPEEIETWAHNRLKS